MFKEIFINTNAILNIADFIGIILLSCSILQPRYVFSKHNSRLNLSGFLIGIGYIIFIIIYDRSAISADSIYFLLSIFILFILLFSMMKLLFKGTTSQVLYCTITFICIYRLCRYFTITFSRLYGYILGLWGNYIISVSLDYVDLYMFLSEWGFSFFNYTVYCFSMLFMIRKINLLIVPNKLSFRKGETAFLLYPSLIGLIMGTLFQFTILIYDDELEYYEFIYDRSPITSILIPIVIALLLSNILIQLKLYLNLNHLHQKKKDAAALEIQLNQTKQHLKDVESLYDGIRSLKHDMNNHISHMQGLAANHELDALQTYFSSVSATVSSLDFKYTTGNPITDVVLNQKYLFLKEKNIDCQIEFYYPSKLKIDSFTVAVILGNLLDNAIESAYSYFNLKCYAKGRLFFIETKNDFSHTLIPDHLNGLLLTTKSQAAEHGMGLRSIKNCVDKYHGTMDLQISAQTFQLTIMMKSN